MTLPKASELDAYLSGWAATQAQAVQPLQLGLHPTGVGGEG